MIFSSSLAWTLAFASLGLVSSAPIADNSTTLADGPVSINVATEHGCSCISYPETDSSGRGRIYVKCDTVAPGVQVRGVWKQADSMLANADPNATPWFWQTGVAQYSDWRENVKGLDTRVEYAIRHDSSNACVVTKEKKPDGLGKQWRIKMDCTSLSPQVRARPVLQFMVDKEVGPWIQYPSLTTGWTQYWTQWLGPQEPYTGIDWEWK